MISNKSYGLILCLIVNIEALAKMRMDAKTVEQTIQRTFKLAREQIELSIDRRKSDQ